MAARGFLPSRGGEAAQAEVASAAFREHLRRLGLQDFPCGAVGTGGAPTPAGPSLPARLSPQEPCPEARARPGPEDEESREGRLELLGGQRSPWALPEGCGPEDQRLRQLAVRAPGLVRGSRLFLFFRVLRLVDKGVSGVDEGLLRFQHLEELVLSANRLSAVASANLPATLKVLELCGNAVGDLRDLCARPPPRLQHLGLGYNCLRGASQHGYLTAAFWPNLVSLDLGFNALADLLGLLSELATLPKLRVLVLRGNPLALLPAYRGLVVDGLPGLAALDDAHVGPGEKHRCRGLAGRPGEPGPLRRHEEAFLNNIFFSLPEAAAVPVVTRSYYVTYELAAAEASEDGPVKQTGPAGATRPRARGERVQRSLPAPGYENPSVSHGGPAGPRWREGGVGHLRPVGQCRGFGEERPLRQAPWCPHAVKVFATPGKPWADPLDCGYRREHAAPDLVGLKAFLEAGTVLSVVEEKVLSWPLVTEPDEATIKKGKAQGLQHGAKQKKKKKEKPCELHSDPPIRRTLGTGRVSLEALLATEALVATVCDLGIPTAEEPPQPPSPEEKKVVWKWKLATSFAAGHCPSLPRPGCTDAMY
uniref:Leucine rich repeat containing 43 n=1 Tax=Dromaius novaehollandiae TaxID=8790 RepID=A0A8C4KBF3_DRONO